MFGVIQELPGIRSQRGHWVRSPYDGFRLVYTGRINRDKQLADDIKKDDMKEFKCGTRAIAAG